MGTLIQDLRFGLRMLRKSPGFTAVAVLTIALGIGANTAMFSVMQGVVLAPLQYVNPDRLVMVWENNPHFPRTWVSYPNFQDWQRRLAHSSKWPRSGSKALISQVLARPNTLMARKSPPVSSAPWARN